MLRLIELLLPRPLHRASLRFAHKARHRWRLWRGVRLEGVSIVATNASGEVLLVRHSYGPQVWTLPGGGMKRGETPVETARRETMEELGVALEQARFCGSVEEVLSGSPHTAHVVAGTLEANPTPDRREIAEAAWFAPDALPAETSPLVASRLAALEQR